MKKFLIFLFSVFAFSLPIFAEEDVPAPPAESTTTGATLPVLPRCSDIYTIVGPTQLKANTAAEYSMAELATGKSVLPYGTFSLASEGNEEEVQHVERERFVHSFSRPEIVKMRLTLDQNVHGCQGDVQSEVHVYAEHIVYLGEERPELSDATLSSVFRDKSVLFEPIFTPNNFRLEDQPTVATAITNADIVVFHSPDILGVFSELEKIQKIKDISFAKKKIFIISSYPKTFLSKVLASPVRNLEAENVSIITPDQLNTLLNQWSYGDNRSATIGEPLSYEQRGFTFSMNSFLEYLSYSGVSYNFLGFMLVLAVVALVFNILKQVVGFDVFSIYYPMMLAIIFAQMGEKFSLVFVILAIISVLLVRFITRHIQLLFNARKAFLVSMYILLIFLALGLDNVLSLGIFDYTHFDKAFAILAIFATLFIVEKIIENNNMFSISGAFLIVQYIVVVAIAIFVLTSRPLQYFLISYPDLIFIIVVLNLLVGRYMGLQLVEYVRFLPILRNINEEE